MYRIVANSCIATSCDDGQLKKKLMVAYDKGKKMVKMTILTTANQYELNLNVIAWLLGNSNPFTGLI